jgi:succinyl-CoA synthetase beta subunit
MKLFEFQGRALFEQYGIPVPEAIVARTAAEAAAGVASLGGSGVLKAQVLVGSRGDAGGIRIVRSADEAARVAKEMFGMSLGDYPVKILMVEELLEIEREGYLSVTVDRSIPAVGCILSATGGVNIERLARHSHDAIHEVTLLADSPPDWDRHRAKFIEILGEVMGGPALEIARNLLRLLREKDCILAEVNPLVLTTGGRVLAADAKVILDDNALWRHDDLEGYHTTEESSEDEREAHEAGLSFVSLDGTIGCMVNGAGLAMATMDTIKLLGGHPANFLDVGGSSNPEKVLTAVRILLRNPKVRVILVNIFGGITRCDDIARGILMARERLGVTLPMVIRLVGTNEAEGHAMLEKAGLHYTREMTEAVRMAVAFEQGKGPQV